MAPGEAGERVQDRVEEEAQPHALTASLGANQVHAVVPVSGPDERQAVAAEPQAPRHRAYAVVVETGPVIGHAGQVVVRILVGVERPAFDEVNLFLEHAGVAGGVDVAARGQGQPQVVVRAVRPDTASRRRMPPVLDVALAELPRRRQQQVLPRERRFRVHQCHHVLELVAEPERAARLIEAAAPPHPARHGLIEQPAVGERVESWVGCFDLDGPERVVPELPHAFERSTRGGRPPAPSHQAGRLFGVAAAAEGEDDFSLLASAQFEAHLDRRARIQGAADATGERRPQHRGWPPQRTVAADELGAVARHAPTCVVCVKEGSPAGELGVVHVPGQHRAGVAVDRGDHVRGGLRPQVTQHPLHVAGGRHPARSAGDVAHLQHRPLHRRRGSTYTHNSDARPSSACSKTL